MAKNEYHTIKEHGAAGRVNQEIGFTLLAARVGTANLGVSEKECSKKVGHLCKVTKYLGTYDRLSGAASEVKNEIRGYTNTTLKSFLNKK